MTCFTPLLIISGASPLFYVRLLKATIRDEEGQKADTLTIELDDRGNVIRRPKDGTKLKVQLGYRETGLVEIGTFEVHGSEIRGEAGEGEFVIIQAKGTSLATARKLKETGSESFPEGATLGSIAGEIAGRNGLSLRIAGALGSVAYPDGAYRHQQSDLDFLGRLVERANGLMKVQGDVLAIAERGSGQSAGGKGLPPILIAKADCKGWSHTPGDRPTYGKVTGSWIDQKTGKKKVETRETGLEGPLFGLREPFKTETEAKKAVEAKAKELSRKSGEVQFTVRGTAIGGAGSDIIASGFRPEINGAWRAKAVEHQITNGPSGGWITKFEGTAPEGGKKQKA
jgi:phage protein D